MEFLGQDIIDQLMNEEITPTQLKDQLQTALGCQMMSTQFKMKLGTIWKVQSWLNNYFISDDTKRPVDANILKANNINETSQLVVTEDDDEDAKQSEQSKDMEDAQKKPKKPKKPRGGNKRGLGKFVCVAKPSEIENKKNVVKFCKLYKINIDNWCLNFGETELQAAEGIAEYEDLFGIAE
eukprot:369321_1